MAYRILLVDDDKEIVQTLQKSLVREGYEVIPAFDGEEALAKLKDSDPDIVLLDLMLPKVSGHEVLSAIRKVHKDKWRPVIVISAKDELESVMQTYRLDADHYLTKPCELEHILRGIRTMISLMPMRKDEETQE
ncbi:MAG: response regulator [Candidatus Omnitrophica bacterium]|nr:response regulator [Candidatus Omnitrophota bacterium]